MPRTIGTGAPRTGSQTTSKLRRLGKMPSGDGEEQRAALAHTRTAKAGGLQSRGRKRRAECTVSRRRRPRVERDKGLRDMVHRALRTRGRKGVGCLPRFWSQTEWNKIKLTHRQGSKGHVRGRFLLQPSLGVSLNSPSSWTRQVCSLKSFRPLNEFVFDLFSLRKRTTSA